jgi:type VI secretion system secreted protein VgrG
MATTNDFLITEAEMASDANYPSKVSGSIPNPGTNKAVTKDEGNSYYSNWDPAPLAAFTNNQCVPYQYWTPIASPTPSVTPTVTPSVTETPSITVTPSVSVTPVSSVTPTPTETPSVSISATPASTPGATLTPTPTETPSVTPTPSISDTPAASPAPGASTTPTPTETPSVTPTETPSVTPTETPSVTPTPSISDTPAASPAPGASTTPTPTETPSVTPTETPSVTPSETPSVTPSETPSVTPTETPTPTPSTPNVTFNWDNWENPSPYIDSDIVVDGTTYSGGTATGTFTKPGAVSVLIQQNSSTTTGETGRFTLTITDTTTSTVLYNNVVDMSVTSYSNVQSFTFTTTPTHVYSIVAKGELVPVAPSATPSVTPDPSVTPTPTPSTSEIPAPSVTPSPIGNVQKIATVNVKSVSSSQFLVVNSHPGVPSSTTITGSPTGVNGLNRYLVPGDGVTTQYTTWQITKLPAVGTADDVSFVRILVNGSVVQTVNINIFDPFDVAVNATINSNDVVSIEVQEG